MSKESFTDSSDNGDGGKGNNKKSRKDRRSKKDRTPPPLRFAILANSGEIRAYLPDGCGLMGDGSCCTHVFVDMEPSAEWEERNYNHGTGDYIPLSREDEIELNGLGSKSRIYMGTIEEAVQMLVEFYNSKNIEISQNSEESRILKAVGYTVCVCCSVGKKIAKSFEKQIDLAEQGKVEGEPSAAQIAALQEELRQIEASWHNDDDPGTVIV